jgi:ArsR family transcriptional regulator
MEDAMDNSYAVNQAKVLVFKALAHPTRLVLVEKLFEREMCVSELMSGMRFDVSTVSRHLSVLKNAGILEDEKRGAMVYYKLVMPCVVEMLCCVETGLWESGICGKGNRGVRAT